MKLVILFTFLLCAYAADVKDEEKEKRQTQEGNLGRQLVYRAARKQEQVAPVEESQEEDKAFTARSDDQYRPGQVFSVNAQELFELQPERKASVNSNQQHQQLYINSQQDQRDHQQIYFLEPQGRQVSLQPSHAVITRPVYSSNGGEASVGAALSVSDTGASSSLSSNFDQEFLALLSQGQSKQEESRLAQETPRPQAYPQPQPQPQPTPTVQSVAPQYQQVDRYVTKSNKKSTKSHAKAHSSISTSQISTAPQQYLIETTNVQSQQHQPVQRHQVHEQQQQQEQQQQVQYRPSPQQHRFPQALRYVPIQSSQPVQQQILYERPETQGLKIVAAPKLQQPQHQRPADSQQQRAQLAYRVIPQYTQPEVSPKQYRIIEDPHPQPVRQEQRLTAPSLERPVAYLKRYPEPEKQRSVKIYEPEEQLSQQQVQGGEQYYLRPVYRINEQRQRYEFLPVTTKVEQQRIYEQNKPPHSAIYVNKNLAPRKVLRPQPVLREQNVKLEQAQELSHRLQASNVENVNTEQRGHNVDDQHINLPPPKNNKAYTPEEFAGLVAAGYSVTPVPVSALSLGIAQSRSSEEVVTSHPYMMAIPRARLGHSRRHQYLPLRRDDEP